MTKKTIPLVLLTLILTAPIVFAKEPDFTPPKLKFVNKIEPEEWQTNFHSQLPGFKPRFQVTRPTHQAHLNILSGSYWGGNNIHIPIEGILQTTTGKTLSPKQTELIKAGYALLLIGQSHGNNSFLIYGIDQQQTEKTTTALVEFITEKARENYQQTIDELKKLRTELPKLEKEKAQLEKELKTAKQKFEEIEKQTHYLGGPEATEAIKRMNQVIETQGIELTVLHAKLMAVSQSLEDEKTIKLSMLPEEYNRQNIVLKLEEMRTELTIELAALNARVNAAENIRELAHKYIQTVHIRTNLETQLNDNFNDLKNNRARQESLQYRLDNPNIYMLPPKPLDSAVKINPVNTED